MNIEEQYLKYGIRFFDISVRMDVRGRTAICYGDTPLETFSVFEMLGFLNRHGSAVVRMTLDDPDYLTGVENKFYVYCANAESMFPNINFCGGYAIGRSKIKLYEFKYETSKTSPFVYATSLPENAGFWRKTLYRICPRLHAFIYNKKVIAEHSADGGVLLLDYVQYQ